MKTVIFVTISFVIFISTKECYACFVRNETTLGIFLQSSDPFYKECSCETEDKVTNLKWLDIHGREIGPMGSVNKQLVYTERWKDSINLHISVLSRTLAGNYTCVAETKSGQRFVHTYELEVYNPLVFYNAANTQYLIKGLDSTITCQARGYTTPSISWHKGGEELAASNDNSKYEFTTTGLVVKNVEKEDEGTYKCTAAVYKTGEAVDVFIKVEVLTAPKIEEIEVNPSHTVVVGDNLSVECIASGFPLPSYDWYKTSGHVANDTKWPKKINKLTFENIEPKDHGTYVCMAQNNAGVAKKEVMVEVQYPPQILLFKNETTAEDTYDVRITCRASGRPKPVLNFTYYDDNIDEDRFRIEHEIMKTSDTETESYLVIDKVNSTDAGFFTCIATNEVDSVEESMYLTVWHKPYFKNEKETIWVWGDNRRIHLNCEHDSQPPAKVEWSFQGSSNYIPTVDQNRENVKIKQLSMKPDPYHYNKVITEKYEFGVYECLAKNNFGKAKKLFTVKEGFSPEKIRNATVVDVKAASATFYIEGPSNVGPPLLAYDAEYDTAENYTITHIHSNRTWADGIKTRLEKLKPNTTYLIRFAARNAVNIGPYSDFLEFTTPDRSIPDAPALDGSPNSSMTSSGRTMVIKLRPTADNGDAIQYFDVKYCQVQYIGAIPDQALCKQDFITPIMQLKLVNLDHSTIYYLKIVAHNSEGDSDPFITYFEMPEALEQAVVEEVLSAGAIIGISIVVVIVCLLLLDALLLLTRRQGLMASCCIKKKKKKDSKLQTRDKKGLLKDNSEATPEGILKAVDNGHKEFEYNKSTGIITGKHSVV